MDEDARQRLLDFEAEHVWVEQNRDRLLSEYPEQWIAVRNGEVTASDPDLEGLLAKVPDSAHTCIEFLSSDPIEILL